MTLRAQIRWHRRAEPGLTRRVTIHDSRCGRFRIDDDEERPPLEPAADWQRWALYRLGPCQLIARAHTAGEAKELAEHAIAREGGLAE